MAGPTAVLQSINQALQFMSPISPVFHTVVTVRIGLKTQLEWENPFYNIRLLCWLAERSTFHFHFLFCSFLIRPIRYIYIDSLCASKSRAVVPNHFLGTTSAPRAFIKCSPKSQI